MSDFRRFYRIGVEHSLHLEQLERSVSKTMRTSLRSEKKIATIRHRLAKILVALAERIEPARMPHIAKVNGGAC